MDLNLSQKKEPEESVQSRSRMLNEVGVLPKLSDPESFDEPAGLRVARGMLEEQVTEFYAEIARYLESELRACEDLRSEYDFDDRHAKSKRRSKAKVHVEVDQNGTVITQLEDGHAEMGICQGWSAQANQMIGAYLYNRLVEAQERPFAVMMRGMRAENRLVEQALTAVLDDLLRRSRFKKRFHNIIHWAPSFGTSVMRYELGREIEVRRGPDGRFIEEDGQVVPVFTCWPLEDVYVSDPDAPEAEDQEKVFWARRGVSLYDLEAEEARFARDPHTGEVEMAAGKYRNLDVLRKDLEKGTMQANRDTVSTFPTYTLVEYEGTLPILSWVRDGVLNYDIADYLGARVGDEIGPDPDNEDEVEEWGRRLAKITHWRVSYLRSEDQAALHGGTGHHVVLQCQPDQHKTMRNSMYVFGYRKHSTQFYRMSTVDVAGALEDAGDTILNSVLYTAYYNAHPAKVVHKQATINKKLEDIQKLFEPNGIVEAPPGVTARDIVEFMELPLDQYAFQKLEYIKREYEYTSGASAAAKGSQGSASESGTLGEIRINEAKANLMLDDIVMDIAREMGRMFADLIQDVMWAYGEQGFAAYAARVAGLPESELMTAFQSRVGVEEEMEITHPMVVVEDRAVQVSLLLQIYQVFGQEVFEDPRDFVSKLLELAGVRYAEQLVNKGASMSPEDEQRQMAMGNQVEPHQDEDFMQHLTTHDMRLQKLSASPPGDVSQYQEALLLRDHITETLVMVKELMEMYEQMAAASGGQAAVLQGGGMQPEQEQQGGGPGNQRGSAGPPPGHTPRASSDQGNDIRQNARSKPSKEAR